MDQSNICCTDLKKKTFALLLHFFKIGSRVSIIIFLFLRLGSHSHGCLIHLPKYFLTKIQGSFCFPPEKVMGLSAPGPFPMRTAKSCCSRVLSPPDHMLSPPDHKVSCQPTTKNQRRRIIRQAGCTLDTGSELLVLCREYAVFVCLLHLLT